MSERIEILVNGKNMSVPSRWTIGQLLDDLELNRRQVAVERNREIVRRDDWDSIELEANDAIEIVHFVGGGSV